LEQITLDATAYAVSEDTTVEAIIYSVKITDFAAIALTE